MPERIQLRRTKGWRKPLGAVKVDRSTRWGNPYVVDTARALSPEHRAQLGRLAVDNFRRNLLGLVELPQFVLPFTIDDVRRELRGKDLACWCKPAAVCHADVLLEVANG